MAEQFINNNEDIKSTFLEASMYVKSISSNLTEEQLLQFYGLYKQAIEGPCLKKKPSWFQLTEKLKWEAWSSQKNLDSKEAMQKYIELVNILDKNWQSASFEKAGTWVHHSSMKNMDEELEETVKTVFDWVKEGNLEKLKSLFNNEMDVNKVDEDGLTLLHWAADRGNLDAVKYLVQNLNADINATDADGQTALHYAAFCSHELVVKFLLEYGADMSIEDSSNQTPYGVANSYIKKIFTDFENSLGH